jgi:flagellar biosynthesis anti-sigma factor FlgM
MRIIDSYGRFNDRAVNTALQGQAATSAPKTGAEDAKGTAAAQGDAVTVSAQAQELAHKAAANADAAKVEKLRTAIENGSFAIDHQVIARRIVDGG